MSPEVQREFARMLAGRQRLLALRSSRIEQLVGVRVVLRTLLADFFETLDPIANVRLAEVSAEGSKAHGVLAVTLAFFEGTRLRLAVDATGRFSHEVSVPSPFDDVARMLEIVISSDRERCDVLYEPIGAPGTRKRLDLIATTLGLLASVVATVEEAVRDAPVVTPAEQRVSAVDRVGGSVGKSSDVRAQPAQPAPPALELPNANVLTFNVG